VDRDLVIQGHYSKIPTAELRDHCPESVAIVLLALDPNRVGHDGDAPLAPKIRSLAKYFVFEILREPILGHDRESIPSDRQPKVGYRPASAFVVCGIAMRCRCGEPAQSATPSESAHQIGETADKDGPAGKAPVTHNHEAQRASKEDSAER
jgi:hypothetical protein